MKGKHFALKRLPAFPRRLARLEIFMVCLFLAWPTGSLCAQQEAFGAVGFFVRPFKDDSIYVPPVSLDRLQALTERIVVVEPIAVERVKSIHDPEVEFNGSKRAGAFSFPTSTSRWTESWG